MPKNRNTRRKKKVKSVWYSIGAKAARKERKVIRERQEEIRNLCIENDYFEFWKD